MTKSIPESWIKEYVDQLVRIAKSFPDGAMRDSATVRADHVIDMVKAWREHCAKTAPDSQHTKP